MIQYAGYTEIHASSKDTNQAKHCVNQDLISISKWWGQNGLVGDEKESEAIYCFYGNL